jgi:hypothetical protein
MLLLLIEWESLWLILCHTWEDRKNDRTEWRTVWMLLMTTIKCIECQTTNSNIIGRFNVWFLISGVPNAPQEQVHPVDGTLQSNNVLVVHWMCNLTYYCYSLACIKGEDPPFRYQQIVRRWPIHVLNGAELPMISVLQLSSYIRWLGRCSTIKSYWGQYWTVGGDRYL